MLSNLLFHPLGFGFPGLFLDKDDTGGGTTGEGETPPEDEQDPEDDKSQDMGLPQDKVNELVGSARKEGRSAAEKAILKKYGVNTQEELDALVQAAKEAEDADKTELEKAQTRLEALQTELDELKHSSGQEKTALQRRVLDTEIKILAGKAITDKDGKVTRPAFLNDALDDVLLLISRDGIKEGDGGKYTGVEEALTALAKSKPYLTAKDPEEESPKKGSPSSRLSFKKREPAANQSGQTTKKRISL